MLKSVAKYPESVLKNYLLFLSSNVADNSFLSFSFKDLMMCSFFGIGIPKKAIIKLTCSPELLTHITMVYMSVGNQEWPLCLNQF